MAKMPIRSPVALLSSCCARDSLKEENPLGRIWENLRAPINRAVERNPTYLTRKMLLGFALAVLGTAVFAFPDITMHNPSSAAFLPMLVAAMLLASGIVVRSEEHTSDLQS